MRKNTRDFKFNVGKNDDTAVEPTPLWHRRVWDFPRARVRMKITLPYLFLTLCVMVVGVYLLTSLIAGSHGERLNNQLQQSGVVVSTVLSRREATHREFTRRMQFTEGFRTALSENDVERIEELVIPSISAESIEFALIVDAEGEPLLHMIRQEGEYIDVQRPLILEYMWIIRDLLELGPVNSDPKVALGLHPETDEYYYFTAIPVIVDDGEKLAGVITVGTSLDSLLALFKSNASADVTVYLDRGNAIASTFETFVPQDAGEELLRNLSLPPVVFEKALGDVNNTQLREWEIEERDYRLAIGALQVGGTSLGAFSVGLPTEFIVNASATSRNRYIPIFIVAMTGVVALGYVVSRFITGPLSQLVQASQAVAQGDLQRRTGIDSPDEIGTLAKTFDVMTESLNKRTDELQIALRRQRETTGRMEAILSSMGDGVLFEEVGGEIMPLNKAAEEMLIQMADNFMLGPLQELASADQNWVEKARKNPWLLDSRRFQVGDRVFTVHSAAVRTDESERLGTVIVLRDITAEVEAERLKDAFVVHVSHELRTPLTVIKGYSALLLSMGESSLDEKQKHFLGAILNNTDDLIMMVSTVLDYSEIEAKGQLGLRPQSVDFGMLVREVTDEWTPQMEDKGLDFDVEIPSEVPVVHADARRLRWALVNIVRNACQYTPEDGSVDVKLSVNDSYVVVDVTDTGPGISAEDQRRIFSRFYRVMKVQEDEKRGIGLGLYVSRAIAEAHKGTLDLVSEVGIGSTFTIQIPIAPPASELAKEN